MTAFVERALLVIDACGHDSPQAREELQVDERLQMPYGVRSSRSASCQGASDLGMTEGEKIEAKDIVASKKPRRGSGQG